MATDVVKNIQANIVSSFENKGFLDAGKAAKDLKKDFNSLFDKRFNKNLDDFVKKMDKLAKAMEKMGKYGGNKNNRGVSEAAKQKGRKLTEQIGGATSKNPGLKNFLDELAGIAKIAEGGSTDALADFGARLSKMPKEVKDALGHVDTAVGDFGESLKKKAARMEYDTKKGHEKILKMWKDKAAEFEKELLAAEINPGIAKKASREMATQEMEKETGLKLGPSLGGMGPVGSLAKSTDMGSAVSGAAKLKAAFVGLKGTLPAIVLTKLVGSILDARKQLAVFSTDINKMTAKSGQIPNDFSDMSRSLKESLAFSRSFLFSWSATQKEVLEIGNSLTDIGFKYESVFSEGSKVFENTMIAVNGLGLSFQDAAQLMSDFQMELGISMDNVVEGMARMRVDASKTSLTTDIFRKDVIQLTKELFMYNIGLTDVSKSMAKMMAQSRLPVKVAEAQTKNLLEALANEEPNIKMYMLTKFPNQKELQDVLEKKFSDLESRQKTLNDVENEQFKELQAARRQDGTFDTQNLNYARAMYDAVGPEMQKKMLVKSIKMTKMTSGESLKQVVTGVYHLSESLVPMIHSLIEIDDEIEKSQREINEEKKKGADADLSKIAGLTAKVAYLNGDTLSSSEESVKLAADRLTAEAHIRAAQNKTTEDLFKEYVTGGFNYLWGQMDASIVPLLAKGSVSDIEKSRGSGEITKLITATQKNASIAEGALEEQQGELKKLTEGGESKESIEKQTSVVSEMQSRFDKTQTELKLLQKDLEDIGRGSGVREVKDASGKEFFRDTGVNDIVKMAKERNEVREESLKGPLVGDANNTTPQLRENFVADLVGRVAAEAQKVSSKEMTKDVIVEIGSLLSGDIKMGTSTMSDAEYKEWADILGDEAAAKLKPFILQVLQEAAKQTTPGIPD